MEDPRCQVAAALRLRGAIRTILEAHGIVWGERLRLVVTMRPGALLVTEADIDAGERTLLAIGLDDREPATFGRRIDRVTRCRATTSTASEIA